MDVSRYTAILINRSVECLQIHKLSVYFSMARKSLCRVSIEIQIYDQETEGLKHMANHQFKNI